MVALVQESHSGEAASGGWQGIRQQLFGQKRERDAEDGLLLVITQLQTKLALATGAAEGPLKSPTARAQALRVIQDGLNTLLGWHADQLAGARAVGAWSGPVPALADDVLEATKAARPLFEGAEVTGGTINAQDLAQSVAQLRGEESGAFFNDALDGFVSMLERVYIRASVDAPTAPTAGSMRETWDVLLDELRGLRWPEIVVELEEAGPGAVEASLGAEAEVRRLETVEETERCELPAPVTVAVIRPMNAPVIELSRFRRLELVAC